MRSVFVRSVFFLTCTQLAVSSEHSVLSECYSGSHTLTCSAATVCLESVLQADAIQTKRVASYFLKCRRCPLTNQSYRLQTFIT